MQELDWSVDPLEAESVDRLAARRVDDPFHAPLRGPLEHANSFEVEIEPQAIAQSLERRGDRHVARVLLNLAGQPIGKWEVLLTLPGARCVNQQPVSRRLAKVCQEIHGHKWRLPAADSEGGRRPQNRNQP